MVGVAVGKGSPGLAHRVLGMAEKHLGPAFEIHGGGLDLVFPHHENEIAQSRALGHQFASIWMHNGMLRFTGEEMHKSTGNDVSLANALERWGRETLLVFFLSGHWRKPLDYSRWHADGRRAPGLNASGRCSETRPGAPPTTRGNASRQRSTTTSTPLTLLQSSTTGAITSCFGGHSASSALARLPRARTPRPA